MVGQPQHRGANPLFDPADGVVLIADCDLLATPQVVLGLAQDLEEQLLLRGEVPVEDALADAHAGDDVGDRRRVVAVLGEALRREVHQLPAAVPAPLGEPPVHWSERYASRDRTVNIGSG